MKHAMISLGAVGVITLTASADILHDTTGYDLALNTLVGMSQSTTTINQPADSIVISGGDFILDTITIRLAAPVLVGAVGGDYEVRFWSNDTNKPGSLLESFTISNSAQLDGGDITLSSLGGVFLEDGQTYWVSAALPDDQSFGLWQAVDGPTNGRAVAFGGDTSSPWFATSATDALYLQVTGTPVPAPAALAALGLGGLIARRRR